jgi:hypothetical protein
MWRSSLGGCVAILASAVLISACSNDSRNSTEPVPPPVSESIVPTGCPTVTQTAQMIVALYPKGADRVTAAAAYAAILVYINTGHQADARTLMFRLLDFTMQRFNAGKLIGGYLPATQLQLFKFEMGLYCTVGLSSTELVPPGNPGDGGTVNKVVFPSTAPQNVVTPNGNGGVQIPPNSFTGPAVLVTITPLPGTGPSGPLNTKLDQYGPFSDVKVTPETALIADVSVGICPSAAVVPLTVFLAHNVTQTVNSTPTPGIEVLPRGAFISGLCGITTPPTSLRRALDLGANGDFASATKIVGSALVDMILPANANATGGGVTGTTRKFSPFGGVDTKVYMTANSPTSQTAPAGSAVASPPSALVKTQLGGLVAKVNVLFSVTSGAGTIGDGSSSTVATGATGVATVSNWVINAGSNSAQAVGTYADPTVTFAPAPVGSGFPQAVAVDPPAGITFTATGGDVVPYGSSYLYTSGTQGFDPNFGTTDFTTTGWSTANGPFGTGDLGGTVCAINSDASFPPNHQWPLGTDLLLLKTFPLPQGWSAPLTVTAAIDNDIQLFVNGHPLTFDQNQQPLFTFSGNDAGNYSFNSETGFVQHENCATKGSLTFSIPATFLNLGGQNTLAIRARDRGTVNYVDAKVSAPIPQ